VDQTIPIQRADEAHAALASNQTCGSIVLTVTDDVEATGST
jgi:hypothetical protein